MLVFMGPTAGRSLEQLVEHAVSGDREACDELLQLHLPGLRAFVPDSLPLPVLAGFAVDGELAAASIDAAGPLELRIPGPFVSPGEGVERIVAVSLVLRNATHDLRDRERALFVRGLELTSEPQDPTARRGRLFVYRLAARLFGHLDANRDGRLSAVELPNDRRTLLEELDRDGDGLRQVRSGQRGVFAGGGGASDAAIDVLLDRGRRRCELPVRRHDERRLQD